MSRSAAAVAEAVQSLWPSGAGRGRHEVGRAVVEAGTPDCAMRRGSTHLATGQAEDQEERAQEGRPDPRVDQRERTSRALEGRGGTMACREAGTSAEEEGAHQPASTAGRTRPNAAWCPEAVEGERSARRVRPEDEGEEGHGHQGRREEGEG